MEMDIKMDDGQSVTYAGSCGGDATAGRSGGEANT